MAESSKPISEQTVAQPVRSPCIGVCALDEKDLCIACRRTGVEIGEWGVLTNEQKQAVMELVRQREREDRN
ncbi:MAG: DUF1289 domain-containing protein [Amphritea sp.]